MNDLEAAQALLYCADDMPIEKIMERFNMMNEMVEQKKKTGEGDSLTTAELANTSRALYAQQFPQNNRVQLIDSRDGSKVFVSDSEEEPKEESDEEFNYDAEVRTIIKRRKQDRDRREGVAYSSHNNGAVAGKINDENYTPEQIMEMEDTDDEKMEEESYMEEHEEDEEINTMKILKEQKCEAQIWHENIPQHIQDRLPFYSAPFSCERFHDSKDTESKDTPRWKCIENMIEEVQARAYSLQRRVGELYLIKKLKTSENMGVHNLFANICGVKCLVIETHSLAELTEAETHLKKVWYSMLIKVFQELREQSLHLFRLYPTKKSLELLEFAHGTISLKDLKEWKPYAKTTDNLSAEEFSSFLMDYLS